MHTLDERIRDEYKDLQTQNLKIGREKCEAVYTLNPRAQTPNPKASQNSKKSQIGREKCEAVRILNFRPLAPAGILTREMRLAVLTVLRGLCAAVELPFVTTPGEVSRGEKMAPRAADTEFYITELL